MRKEPENFRYAAGRDLEAAIYIKMVLEAVSKATVPIPQKNGENSLKE